MQNTLPFAPLWRRLLSLVYEAFLVFAMTLVSGGLFQLLLTPLAGSPVEFAFVISILLGHFAWCWRRSGQTLAMKVWRLRLLDAQGAPLSMRAVLIRFTATVLAFVPLAPAWGWAKHHPADKWLLWLAVAWALLPYLWALLDKQRLFLHDRLAGTKMVLVPIVRSEEP